MISKIILIGFATIFFHGVVYCTPPNLTEKYSEPAIKTVDLLPTVKGELPPTNPTTKIVPNSTESTTVTMTISSSKATTKTTEIPSSTKTSEATKRTTETTITTPTTVTTPVPVKTTRVENHSTESMHTTDRQFDGPSFIGGIVLTIGLTAIGFIAFKFYKSGKTEENYGRL